MHRYALVVQLYSTFYKIYSFWGPNSSTNGVKFGVKGSTNGGLLQTKPHPISETCCPCGLNKVTPQVI